MHSVIGDLQWPSKLHDKKRRDLGDYSFPRVGTTLAKEEAMISSVINYHAPFASIKAPPTSIQLHAFADVHYLRGIISHLESARKRKGIRVGELTQLAGLRKGIIRHAERNGVIPKTKEFRAWANALELSWEQVWSASFPTYIG